MTDPYQRIENYGAIGNLRTVALVSLDGSIDWCCLPDLDSPGVFAALLDHARGGRFRIRPQSAYRSTQWYVEHTNILVTAFECDAGRLLVTDFMPLRGSIRGGEESVTEPAIYRLLEAEGAALRVEVTWSPLGDFGRARTRLAPVDGGCLAQWEGMTLRLAGISPDAEIRPDGPGSTLTAVIELQAGEQRALATRCGGAAIDVRVERVRERLDETITTWRDWIHKEEATGDRSWAGAYSERVIRSELTLKLLTHAESGAFAAAATTSLPEEIGGVRNWDYRMSWIRDAALCAQAMFALGHRQDAQAFIDWAMRAAAQEGRRKDRLQILYGLRGQADLHEEGLPNLEGYRRSSPVRIGNAAVDQLQSDIYGELLSAAYELARMGGHLAPEAREFLAEMADEACSVWNKPCYGIWELRNGPFHFVYSKAMVCMALERAIRLEKDGFIKGDVNRWRRTCSAIREEVLEKGFDKEPGAFRQSYERGALDASNLLIPLMEFLPFSDDRVQGNIDRTLEGLSENGLVYRYKADDGIAGGEGAFGLCTFWMTDVLTLSDRMDEAYDIFEGMLSRANHLGLYSEQIDPQGGAFLGNFPQAFSHVGLINSALYLAYKEGRDTPVPDPIGSDEHRAQWSG